MSVERARYLLLQALEELSVDTPPPVVAPPPVVLPPPVVTPPASGGAGCGEFSPFNVEMAWPATSNNVKRCPPGWTGDRAAVIHFKAGTAVGDAASFQFAHTGPPYQMMVASLSNAAGCNVCRDYPPRPPILAAAAGGTPIFRFVVGTARRDFITLQPGADYWITAVWRNGFGANFTPSCADGVDGGAGVRFDFNT